MTPTIAGVCGIVLVYTVAQGGAVGAFQPLSRGPQSRMAKPFAVGPLAGAARDKRASVGWTSQMGRAPRRRPRPWHHELGGRDAHER